MIVSLDTCPTCGTLVPVTGPTARLTFAPIVTCPICGEQPWQAPPLPSYGRPRIIAPPAQRRPLARRSKANERGMQYEHADGRPRRRTDRGPVAARRNGRRGVLPGSDAGR